jgi:hypothetical protein
LAKPTQSRRQVVSNGATTPRVAAPFGDLLSGHEPCDGAGELKETIHECRPP